MPGANRADLTYPEVFLGELSGGRRSLLRLTVLFHPQIDRVGSIADLDILQGEEFALSRLEPVFNQPRDHSGVPLEDGYLSRKPLLLQWCDESLSLCIPSAGSSVLLDGQRITGRHRVAEGRLRQGVVLVLARRLVLYMQLAGPQPIADDRCALVGDSAALQKVRTQVCELAVSDAPVLLLGESGTGKELVARAIHRRSSRGDAQLLTINMAAIATELAAAELFGAGRGSYTGAHSKKEGYFQRADGGTLFMDEIGEAPGVVQPQLLRALENGEVQPAGGDIRTVDVRVISATDARLDGQGGPCFSRALRHRLSALEIRLPPLRERVDDIGRLVFHFIAHYEKDSGSVRFSQNSFQDPTRAAQWALLLSAMATYPWPGNVRELRNYCRQIVLASASAPGLTIPENILTTLSGHHTGNAAIEGVNETPAASTPQRETYRPASTLADNEVRSALLAAGWEVARAARELNVSRPALYKRIELIPEIRLASDIPVAELQDAYRRCGGELEQAVAMLEVSPTALQQRWRALDLL